MRTLPPWLLCYVLVGLVQSGMVPIILPLSAAPGPTAGLTYAAFAAAGLAAPLIGVWSDRYHLHRITLAAGLTLAGVTLLAHPLPGGLVQHMVMAALIGLGGTSANTVATMFIVEVDPPALWDRRISALQACNGAGQLAGLLLAGALSLRHIALAYEIAGGAMLLAVPLALRFAPDPVVKIPRHDVRPRPSRGGDTAPSGVHRSFHLVTWAAILGMRRSGLAWFLAAWLASYTATNAFSVMFPVAMLRDLHVATTWSTGAYAIGVGLGLALYRLVGGWDGRFGAWRVLALGLGLRVVIYAAVLGLAWSAGGWTILPILAAFGLTQITWPLLSVSSTTLAVTLSPAHRAASAGLLNAVTALGATLGGIAGGLLLQGGFVWLGAATVGSLAIALLLALHPGVRLDAPVVVQDGASVPGPRQRP